MTTIRGRKGLAGSAMAAALRPDKGKPVQKDHHRENMKKMRDLQKYNREVREIETENLAPEPFKMERFKHIGAKVSAEPKGGVPEPRASSSSSNARTSPAKPSSFLKAQSKRQVVQPLAIAAAEGRLSTFQRPTRSTKGAVPSQQELEEREYQLAENRRELGMDEPVDFIAANAMRNIRQGREGSGKSNKKDPQYRNKEDFGKVPKYLTERKAEMKATAEEKKEKARRAKLPAGMVVMGDEERLETVKTLRENLAQLEDQLSRGPLLVETLSQKRRQAEMQDKIKQVEDALKIFDRPVVYISE